MTRQAFQDIWIPLQGRFYRIAFYILENEADARDAVQDLYLKLWNLRDHLELIRNPQYQKKAPFGCPERGNGRQGPAR